MDGRSAVRTYPIDRDRDRPQLPSPTSHRARAHYDRGSY